MYFPSKLQSGVVYPLHCTNFVFFHSDLCCWCFKRAFSFLHEMIARLFIWSARSQMWSFDFVKGEELCDIQNKFRTKNYSKFASSSILFGCSMWSDVFSTIFRLQMFIIIYNWNVSNDTLFILNVIIIEWVKCFWFSLDHFYCW